MIAVGVKVVVSCAAAQIAENPRVDEKPVWSIVRFVVGRRARGKGVAFRHLRLTEETPAVSLAAEGE